MIPVLKTIWTERKKVSEQRLTICNECAFFRKRGSKCEKCGCFMEYKTMIMNASCPIGKWKSHVEGKNNE